MPSVHCIRIIPKVLAATVPIEISTEADFATTRPVSCVLIDDNALTLSTWTKMLTHAGHRILALPNFSEFLRLAYRVPKTTRIYVDQNLGHERGDEITRRLFQRGFTELYITTGESPEKYERLPWLKGVRGKRVPEDL
jgi:hypothetical protein